jgi:cytochrome c556
MARPKHALILSLCTLVPLALATVAMAHSGVKNPAVLARMNGMKAIGDATKTVGEMAKGNRAFDSATARQAFESIATEAARVPALFATPEDDPKSEARADIWAQFGDFESKSRAMQSLAEDLAGSVTTLNELRDAMPRLGDSCSACHRLYRD